MFCGRHGNQHRQRPEEEFDGIACETKVHHRADKGNLSENLACENIGDFEENKGFIPTNTRRLLLSY